MLPGSLPMRAACLSISRAYFDIYSEVASFSLSLSVSVNKERKQDRMVLVPVLATAMYV